MLSRQKESKAPEDFCNFIRARMEERGMSLRRLAERAGISPSFLHRILKRERGLPSDNAILAIAEALDIEPPDQLLVEAGRVPLRREAIPKLLRAVGPLSDKDIQAVIKTAEAIRLKHSARKGRG